jgi:drug/metabolite transporter (DMT)-like permease
MSSRAWVAFAGVSTLWGMPYLLIKVAVDDGLGPAFVTWARVVLGATVLLGLAWRAGVLSTLRGRAWWLVVVAASEITVPFTLIAVGEQHVSSSLAAIVIATAPLFVVLLALRFDPSERAGGLRLIGLLLGLAGVVALVGIDVAGSRGELLGAAVILAAAFCYAVGPMAYKRHLADLDPRASMGASLAIASFVLTPAVAIDPPAAIPSAAASLSLVGLGLFCTAAALVLYGILIAEAGASRALVITYINPLIAVALGITILGERPGIGAAAGLPLILAGSWLSTRGHRPTTGSRARSSTRAEEQRHTAGRLFTNDGDTLSYGLCTRGRHHDDLDGGEASRPSTTAGSAPTRRLGEAVRHVDVVDPGHGAVAEGPEVAARLAADRAYINALRRGEQPVNACLGPDADWLSGPHRSNLEQARGR